MRALTRGLHDIWCAATHRCRVTGIDDDDMIVHLRRHEQASLQAAQESREKQHWYEDELLRRLEREGRHDAERD